MSGEKQILPLDIPLAVAALANAAQALAAVASALQENFAPVPKIQSSKPASRYPFVFALCYVPTFIEVGNELMRVKARANRCDGYLKLLRQGLQSFSSDVGKRPVDQIFSGDVEKWFDRLPLGDRTKRNRLEIVRLAFSFAVKRGYTMENPAAALELPNRTEREETKIHSPSEVETVCIIGKSEI